MTIWENCAPPEISVAILSFVQDGTLSYSMAKQVLDHFHDKHMRRVQLIKRLEPQLDFKIEWKRLT